MDTNTIETVGKKPSEGLLNELKKVQVELTQKASELKQETERLNYKYSKILGKWLFAKKINERSPFRILKPIFLIIAFLFSGLIIFSTILTYNYLLTMSPLEMLEESQVMKNLIASGLPFWVLIPTIYWLLIDLNHLAVFCPLSLAEKIISLKGKQEEISEKIEKEGRHKGLKIGKNVLWFQPSKSFFYLLPLVVCIFLPDILPKIIFSIDKFQFSFTMAIAFYVILLFLTPIWALFESLRLKQLIKQTPKEILVKFDELFNTFDKLNPLIAKAHKENISIDFEPEKS